MKLEISCCKGACPNKTTAELMDDGSIINSVIEPSSGDIFGIRLERGWSFEVVETEKEALATFVCPNPKHVKYPKHVKL